MRKRLKVKSLARGIKIIGGIDRKELINVQYLDTRG
jgi:hypothetical protein